MVAHLKKKKYKFASVDILCFFLKNSLVGIVLICCLLSISPNAAFPALSDSPVIKFIVPFHATTLNTLNQMELPHNTLENDEKPVHLAEGAYPVYYMPGAFYNGQPNSKISVISEEQTL